MHNRGYFEDRVAAEFAFVRRHGSPLSVLLIDIDYEVRATNTAFNLVYPFYVQQGAGA